MVMVSHHEKCQLTTAKEQNYQIPADKIPHKKRPSSQADGRSFQETQPPLSRILEVSPHPRKPSQTPKYIRSQTQSRSRSLVMSPKIKGDERREEKSTESESYPYTWRGGRPPSQTRKKRITKHNAKNNTVANPPFLVQNSRQSSPSPSHPNSWNARYRYAPLAMYNNHPLWFPRVAQTFRHYRDKKSTRF